MIDIELQDLDQFFRRISVFSTEIPIFILLEEGY